LFPHSLQALVCHSLHYAANLPLAPLRKSRH
jgi:hypothetical protein